MARKRPAVVVESGPGRIVSFRAPDTIHGAIKQIVGKLEMGSLKIDGKSPSGQDVLTWLVADLYTAGDEQWAKRVDEAHRRYLDLVSRN